MLLASRQIKVKFALGSSCQIKVKKSAPKQDQERVAAPGFMFTVSSEINHQVSCVYSTLKALSPASCQPCQPASPSSSKMRSLLLMRCACFHLCALSVLQECSS